MTDIDKAAEIDVVLQDQQLTLRMPLDGEVTQDWARRYQNLARAKQLPARAENHPGRGWVIVDLPGYTALDDATATLDAARELISAADAHEDAGSAEDLATAIRRWWAGQQG